MRKVLVYSLLVMGLIVIHSCQKEETGPNPFDENQQNQDTVGFNIVNPEPTSFAGIYQNTFKPTCANVGCHDGTFEPDFRTMEAAYNTLLFQVPIKNDGNYSHRVVPNDLGNSALIARLENRLSPPMPIQIEPDSDWPAKGDQYIQDIKTWINNGAPDITGQVAQRDEESPKLRGLAIKFDNLWVDRRDGDMILHDTMDLIELYVSFETLTTPLTDLTENKIYFSQDINNFDSAVEMDLSIMGTPILHRGLDATETEYVHRLIFNPREVLGSDSTTWYMRTKVGIPGKAVHELPNDQGILFIKKYMSFEIE